jgi:hypothetical protein
VKVAVTMTVVVMMTMAMIVTNFVAVIVEESMTIGLHLYFKAT